MTRAFQPHSQLPPSTARRRRTGLQDSFDQLVLHSRMPLRLAWLVTIFLPWLELTCGFCLVQGAAVREAAVLLSLPLELLLAWPLFQPDAAECGRLLFPRALAP